MITKGYDYVINLGIAKNFYIGIPDPVYPGSSVDDLLSWVNAKESGIYFLYRSSSPLFTISFERT